MGGDAVRAVRWNPAMKRDPLSAAQGAPMRDAKPTSLSALYQHWRKPLVQLLQGRFGTRAEAEDATQQVFAQMAASDKQPEAGKEQAYLIRSASHVAIDGWRKSGKAQAIVTVSIEDASEELASLAADDEHDPALRAQHRQRLARLDDALTELPERQRQAFALNVLDGHTQEEVAAQMGISLRMVSKHVSRAYAYCELRLQYGSLEQMQRLRTSGRHDASRPDDIQDIDRESERGTTT